MTHLNTENILIQNCSNSNIYHLPIIFLLSQKHHAENCILFMTEDVKICRPDDAERKLNKKAGVGQQEYRIGYLA